MGLQSVLCIVSLILAYSSISDAQLPDLSSFECNNEAESLDEDSFSLDHTVSPNGDGTWGLRYSITWDARPCFCVILYTVSLKFENQETTLEPWNFTDCNEAVRAADGNDDIESLDTPSFDTDAPFTHRGLFRVIYGRFTSPSPGSPLPISPATNIFFETPDCYEATGDAEFCSSQDVHRSSAPRGVMLLDATDTYGTERLRFRWEPPVQVNSMAVLHEYSAELTRTADDEMVLVNRVPAGEGPADANEVIWDAINTDGNIEEGQNYSLVVVPYVSFPGENTDPAPGRSVEYLFTAGPIRYVTQFPTASPGFAIEPGQTTEASKSTTDGKYPTTSSSSSFDTVVIIPSSIIIIIVIVALSVVFSLVACVVVALVRRRRVASDDVNLEKL